MSLGAPFEVEVVEFDAGAQKGPESLRLNPQGRAPTLVIDGAGAA
jgi:glutathione S-transferase